MVSNHGMVMKLKVGHFQCACQAKDYEANLSMLLRGLDQAVSEKLDIVSFPESFLTGYFELEEKMRAHACRMDSPEIKRLLEATRKFPLMFLVGFMEIQDKNIYNTVIVCEAGKLIGSYRKAFPCTHFETPGRIFDVFEKEGVKFGIVICADGGYIEPARILALKGAKIIFAPHCNYMPQQKLVDHFLVVRHDHIARAVENGVWFLRGNSYQKGPDAGLSYSGIGYGDSYLLDPNGDVVVRAGLYRETLISATIDTDITFYSQRCQQAFRSRISNRELGALLNEVSLKTE